jgi:hypothetical protein
VMVEGPEEALIHRLAAQLAAVLKDEIANR